MWIPSRCTRSSIYKKVVLSSNNFAMTVSYAVYQMYKTITRSWLLSWTLVFLEIAKLRNSMIKQARKFESKNCFLKNWTENRLIQYTLHDITIHNIVTYCFFPPKNGFYCRLSYHTSLFENVLHYDWSIIQSINRCKYFSQYIKKYYCVLKC